MSTLEDLKAYRNGPKDTKYDHLSSHLWFSVKDNFPMACRSFVENF